ncbi:MAG: DUF305 domain-containing protein [Eubacterium sp.]
MNRQCELNDRTREYLNKYYCILDHMIQGMTEVRLSDSISYNFMVQMIPHHRAAIEMSENILGYTDNQTLQTIAENIIKAQTESIANMESILCKCMEVTDSVVCLENYQCRMDKIMQNMFCRMDNARAANQIDCNFLWEMIPHHMGAVEMSQTTLRFGICADLKPILEAIIISQKRGIMQMRQLQRCLMC